VQLTFAVTVGNSITESDIVNTVSVEGVDCAAAPNDCTEAIPVDTPPQVSISSPAEGDLVPDAGFKVIVSASDNSIVETVVVNDGNDDFPAIYNSTDDWWEADLTGPYADGADIDLTATAKDEIDTETTSSTVTVTVIDASLHLARNRHLLDRITFGITPTLLDDINTGAFDRTNFINSQLYPVSGDCVEPNDAHGTGVDSEGPFGKNLPDGIGQTSTGSGSLGELQTYSILMATYNPCQLQEVLAHFWSNHFSTQWNTVRSKYKAASGETDDNIAGLQATAWELQESDAFRANALGNFRNLVEISAKSPANLHYLDNVISIAGNPNENYPRELMELNTLSVDGGYTQTDVEEVAEALTGWTVDPITKQFTCDPATHDFAAQIDLDQLPVSLAARTNDGSQATCEMAGQFVLDNLVNHPSTAGYICEKLTFLLLSEEVDSPDYTNAVSACSAVYLADTSNPDQIADMVQAILATDAFMNADNYLDKVKTPIETAVAYLRNFEISDDGDLDDMRYETSQMSMNLFQWHHPDGFPEESDYWVNSSLIVERLRFYADMAFNTSPTSHIYIDPLNFFNDKSKTTAVEIVDYLMDLAMSNHFTAQEHSEALDILNEGTAYDTEIDISVKTNKLRRMLALALNYPGHQYK
jgi:hypothetical protein